MDNKSIKKNIRNIRKAQKLTQEEMAHRIGISLTAYRDLEMGKTSIMSNHVKTIANLLETTTEEILLGYVPCHPDDNYLKDLHAEYQSRIKLLENRISDLETLVSSYKEIIDSKNEIISMLKKKADKEIR